MKFRFKILIFLSAVLSGGLSYGKTPLTEGFVCVEGQCHKYQSAERLPVLSNSSNTAEYHLKFNLNSEACFLKKSCYLFLGAVGDTFKMKVGDRVLIDKLRSENAFIYHDSVRVAIPPEFLAESLDVLITVKDLNGTLFGLLTDGIFIGTEQETFLAQSFDWIVRTGITLFSAYTLAMLSIIVFLLLFIKYDQFILAIFLYCLAAGAYLISFSEYPRRLSPELLSGHVHFFLRLLQDLVLFITFHIIFTNSFRIKNFFNAGVLLYGVFLASFPILFLLGETSYQVAKTIIYIGAPLVALPMGYAFYLATTLPKGFEKSLLLPVTGLLFLMQFHDLLLFWQIIHSYFMVKFYIPFIVVLLLYIQVRRYADDYSEKARISEMDLIVKQVIHDIKSPVGALMVVVEKAKIEGDLRELADMAVTRMKNLIKVLQFESSLPGTIKEVNATEAIKKIIKEKEVEYAHRKIAIAFDCKVDQFIYANEFSLSRILSNILNNSIEASPDAVAINIHLLEDGKKIILKIADGGIGIPSKLIKNIGKFGFTFGKKDLGSGLGIYSAIRTLRAWGADLQITSSELVGTVVTLRFSKKFVSKSNLRGLGRQFNEL